MRTLPTILTASLFTWHAVHPPAVGDGKGQSGLIVAVWNRAAWADRLPPHGFAASIGVAPPELLAKFTVSRAD